MQYFSRTTYFRRSSTVPSPPLPLPGFPAQSQRLYSVERTKRDSRFTTTVKPTFPLKKPHFMGKSLLPYNFQGLHLHLYSGIKNRQGIPDLYVLFYENRMI